MHPAPILSLQYLYMYHHSSACCCTAAGYQAGRFQGRIQHPANPWPSVCSRAAISNTGVQTGHRTSVGGNTELEWAQQVLEDYRVVRLLRSGDYFGEHSCLTGTVRSASVVSLRYSETLSLTKPGLDRIMETHQKHGHGVDMEADSYKQLLDDLYSSQVPTADGGRDRAQLVSSRASESDQRGAASRDPARPSISFAQRSQNLPLDASRPWDCVPGGVGGVSAECSGEFAWQQEPGNSGDAEEPKWAVPLGGGIAELASPMTAAPGSPFKRNAVAPDPQPPAAGRVHKSL